MFLSYEDLAEFELYHLLYIEIPEEDRAGNPFSRGRRGGRGSSAGHVRGSCIFRVPPRHRAAPPVPSPRPR